MKQFLFFDINSLVIHYMKRLELLKKDEVGNLFITQSRVGVGTRIIHVDKLWILLEYFKR